MRNRQVMTVAILAAVLAWSTVMTVLGQLAAVAALLPSLGLLVQQIVSALGPTGARQSPTAPAPAPAAGACAGGPAEGLAEGLAGSEEPTR
ncbi:hypothetical protein [Streptomyces sp. CRN 30]|uniref:hypothetical protein n=1 Tax=Streptomyces sp. CRN 30 TaxID=3075613 RepID=UPI002A7F5A38|nr:hypothetical protein [Streptomyces sp. CRN 30]